MTEINPAGWLQNAGATHTAAQLRSYVGSLSAGRNGTTTTLIPRGGVNPILGGILAITQTGSPSMAVVVASGLAYVPGSANAVQGTYVCQNDANVTLSVTAAHATLPRLDIVVAQVEDAFYAGAVNAWKLAVIAGTPASSPVVPSSPANSLTLAEVLVPAAASSISNANITDRRPFVAGVGGTIMCTSTSRPNVLSVPEGQLVFETDTNTFRYSDTSTWKRLTPPAPIVSTLGSSFGATTTESTFLTASYTVISGETIEIALNGQYSSNGADRTVTVRLKEDGTTIATRLVGSPLNNLSFPFAALKHRTPSAGSRTYTATAQMGTFTGNILADAELSITVKFMA